VVTQLRNQRVSGAFFPRIYWPIHEACSSLPSSVDDKKGRGCAPTAPYGFMASTEKTVRFIVDITLQMPHLCQT